MPDTKVLPMASNAEIVVHASESVNRSIGWFPSLLNHCVASAPEMANFLGEKEDYANPIEPSHQGGEKLATKLVEWVDATS